jgi:hypothetical protein
MVLGLIGPFATSLAFSKFSELLLFDHDMSKKISKWKTKIRMIRSYGHSGDVKL